MITKVEVVSKELKESATHTDKWLNNIIYELHSKDGSQTQKAFSIVMHGCLKNRLKELFGKASYVFTTWYRDWSWLVEYKGNIFLIRSSRRGTSYWLVKGKKDAEICYEFYKELYSMYKEIGVS